MVTETIGVAGARHSWKSMRDRCSTKHGRVYEDYRARGIVVCRRWRKFANFLADMGERPEGMTLDRINNDGNYEPGNCRWATRAEQSWNRRSTFLVTAFGETKCAGQWARDDRCAVPNYTIIKRIKEGGWDAEKAITTPILKDWSRRKQDRIQLMEVAHAILCISCATNRTANLSRVCTDCLNKNTNPFREVG